RKLLNYALDKGSAPAEVRAFCDAIVDAGRVNLLPEVIKVFAKIIREAEGVLDACVVSATPLPSGDKTAIENTLTAVFKKKISLQEQQDSSILGGFIVDVGNYKVDLSLKTKIEQLAHDAAVAQ